jgi:hypothetical protein
MASSAFAFAPYPLLALFPLGRDLGEDMERETLAYFLNQAEDNRLAYAIHALWRLEAMPSHSTAKRSANSVTSSQFK